jgi:glycosyltransferase involved in cell wall biosynthesis
MQKNQQHKDTNSDLSNLRVIGVLTGLELFGNERDNIEAYLALREQGAKVLVGISKNQVNSNVEEYLEKLGFETFNIPFGNQWSWMWLKLYPLSIFEKLNQLWNCSRLLLNQIKIFQPTHIQINSFMGYNYVMPALFLANVTVIYRMVDGVPDDSFYNLQIWRLATKQSSKVVVISKFVEQQVLSQDVPLSKVKKLYSLAPSRTRSIQPFIQNTELNGLVYVGQVTEHKGLWQLLYAFNEIQEYGFELIIIGSSRYDINFRQQLENWVASQKFTK